MVNINENWNWKCRTNKLKHLRNTWNHPIEWGDFSRKHMRREYHKKWRDKRIAYQEVFIHFGRKRAKFEINLNDRQVYISFLIIVDKERHCCSSTIHCSQLVSHPPHYILWEKINTIKNTHTHTTKILVRLALTTAWMDGAQSQTEQVHSLCEPYETMLKFFRQIIKYTMVILMKYTNFHSFFPDICMFLCLGVSIFGD